MSTVVANTKEVNTTEISNTYRYDHRTKEEFERDIQQGTAIEQDIIGRYAKAYLKRYGKELQIIQNGCDMTGGYLEAAMVTTQADYLVGKNKMPVEVKSNKSKRSILNLKVSQVKSYIKQNAHVLLVNGYSTNRPQFTWFSPTDLVEISNTKEVVENSYWGNKKCYKLFAKDYTWHDLNI